MKRLLAFLRFSRGVQAEPQQTKQPGDSTALLETMLATSQLYGFEFHPSLLRHYGK
ncbi:hypothetical protein ACWA06_04780 [Serratia rhizosphaerae]